MNYKIAIFDLDDTLFDRFGQLDETYKNLPNITPFPEAKKALSALSAKGFKKILVSCGDPAIQRKKVEVLGIGKHFDEIILCAAQGEKKASFEWVAKKYGAKNDEVFVVGDRVDAEIRYGNMLGMTTILHKHGKYKNLKAKDKFEVPMFTITNIGQAVDIICGQ